MRDCGVIEMGQFIAKNYMIEYDSAKLEIEVMPAFNDLIVVILRGRRVKGRGAGVV